MSNEKKFLVEGSKYQFIVDYGQGAKPVIAEWLGFEVHGGVTVWGLKYKDKNGNFEPYYALTTQIFGYEPYVEAATDQATKHSEAAQTVTEPVTIAATPVVGEQPIKRGRGRPRKNIIVATTTPGVTAEAKKRGRPRKDITATPTAPVVTAVDAAGVPIPRKRGRPRKDAHSVTPPVPANASQTVTHTATTIPPNIPTPHTVEEVDEIEESVTATTNVTKEKEVTKAVAPTVEASVTTVAASKDDADDNAPKSFAQIESDGEEVVPVRQNRLPIPGGLPVRPTSSLARVTHMPDEVDGDL